MKLDVIENACKEKIETMIQKGNVTYQQLLVTLDQLQEEKQQLRYAMSEKQKEKLKRNNEVYQRFLASGMTVSAFVRQECADPSQTLKRSQLFNIIREGQNQRKR